MLVSQPIRATLPWRIAEAMKKTYADYGNVLTTLFTHLHQSVIHHSTFCCTHCAFVWGGALCLEELEHASRLLQNNTASRDLDPPS